MLISRRKLILGSGALAAPAIIRPNQIAARALRGIFGNPLTFPARPPGFNPLHPASNIIRFSAVPIGGNFVSLMQGAKPGVVTATLLPVIDPQMGAAINFSGTTSRSAFSGAFGAIVESTTTMALIANYQVLSGSPNTLETADNGAGWNLHTNGTSVRLTTEGVADHNLSLTLTAGVPFFIAISASSAQNLINGVITNLLNGKISKATTTASTPVAGSGNPQINSNLAGSSITIAAAMISGAFLSMSQMLQWAADPWAFWYPEV